MQNKTIAEIEKMMDGENGKPEILPNGEIVLHSKSEPEVKPEIAKNLEEAITKLKKREMDFLSKKEAQFDYMYDVLKRISKYESPEYLMRYCEKEYGLNYLEALEMAYENVIGEAMWCLKKLRKVIKNAPAINKEV